MSAKSDWDSIFTIDKHYEEIPNSARTLWTNNYPQEMNLQGNVKIFRIKVIDLMLSENNTLQELKRDKLHAVKMAVVKSMEYIRGAFKEFSAVRLFSPCNQLAYHQCQIVSPLSYPTPSSLVQFDCLALPMMQLKMSDNVLCGFGLFLFNINE